MDVKRMVCLGLIFLGTLVMSVAIMECGAALIAKPPFAILALDFISVVGGAFFFSDTLDKTGSEKLLFWHRLCFFMVVATALLTIAIFPREYLGGSLVDIVGLGTVVSIGTVFLAIPYAIQGLSLWVIFRDAELPIPGTQITVFFERVHDHAEIVGYRQSWFGRYVKTHWADELPEHIQIELTDNQKFITASTQRVVINVGINKTVTSVE